MIINNPVSNISLTLWRTVIYIPLRSDLYGRIHCQQSVIFKRTANELFWRQNTHTMYCYFTDILYIHLCMSVCFFFFIPPKYMTDVFKINIIRRVKPALCSECSSVNKLFYTKSNSFEIRKQLPKNWRKLILLWGTYI